VLTNFLRTSVQVNTNTFSMGELIALSQISAAYYDLLQLELLDFMRHNPIVCSIGFDQMPSALIPGVRNPECMVEGQQIIVYIPLLYSSVNYPGLYPYPQ